MYKQIYLNMIIYEFSDKGKRERERETETETEMDGRLLVDGALQSLFFSFSPKSTKTHQVPFSSLNPIKPDQSFKFSWNVRPVKKNLTKR